MKEQNKKNKTKPTDETANVFCSPVSKRFVILPSDIEKLGFKLVTNINQCMVYEASIDNPAFDTWKYELIVEPPHRNDFSEPFNLVSLKSIDTYGEELVLLNKMIASDEFELQTVMKRLFDLHIRPIKRLKGKNNLISTSKGEKNKPQVAS